MKKKIKFINLVGQYQSISGDMKKQFGKIFSNSSFVLREHVSRFEKQISKKLKVKYVVGLNSGTDALLMALAQLNIKKGDEIITPSHTYVATVSAITHVGAKPVFVDITNDFNIDTKKIEKKINKKTKAIVPVHLNGRSCDMKTLMSISKKHKIPVIEDAAQSFGTKFNDKFTGTFGQSGAFSLHPMKNLSVPGDGGFLVTNNKKIFQNVCLLRDHGRSRIKRNYKLKSEFLKCFGFNSRLDNIHASVALLKLKKIDSWINKRRSIANYYHKFLINNKNLVIPKFDNYKKNVFFDTYNSYVIRVLKKRDQLKRYLEENGIEVFIHMERGVHLEKFLKVGKWKLPITEKLEKQILSLPIYPELKISDQKYIISKVNNFFRK